MKAQEPCLTDLSVELLERMAGTLRVLAHPQRLRIVEILEAETEAPVHEIVARLGLPQAAISQHLNHMRRAGLLKARRRGKEVWYGIAEPSSLIILDCIREKQGRAPA
jgi:ArsR family transcriptional regulator